MKVSILFCLLLFISSCSDIQQIHFDNYSDLLNSDYFKKGWIPDIIPICSYDINEEHDLDLNTGFGTFKFKYFPNTTKPTNSLKQIDKNEVIRLLSRRYKQKQINSMERKGYKLKYYKYKYFVFIIDKENKIGTFYFL